jgi:hypothetical protein
LNRFVVNKGTGKQALKKPLFKSFYNFDFQIVNNDQLDHQFAIVFNTKKTDNTKEQSAESLTTYPVGRRGGTGLTNYRRAAQ